MAYRWSEPAGRFVDERGRFVAASTVRDVVDAVADAASERLVQSGRRLLNGEVSLTAWQAEAQRTIKLAHASAAVIAQGGAARMTPSTWGAAGRRIRTEYGYLRAFAQQVASGEQPLNGSLTARAGQYGQGARVTFEAAYGRGQQRRGYQSCRNVLHPAEHCAGCRAEAAKGWVPIGSLVPIGSRTCRGNDRCTVSYRREPASTEAAA